MCIFFATAIGVFINTSVGLHNNGPFLRSQLPTSRGSCPDSGALSTQTQSIQSQIRSTYSTVAEYIDPWLVDQVNSGIGLSYRSASHECSLAIRYDNTMPELTLSPSHGFMNSATGSKEWEQRGAGKGANVRNWSRTVAIEVYLSFEHPVSVQKNVFLFRAVLQN